MPPTLDESKTSSLFPTSYILHPPRLGKGQPLAQMKPSSTLIWKAERENSMLFTVLLMVAAAGPAPLCSHSGRERCANRKIHTLEGVCTCGSNTHTHTHTLTAYIYTFADPGSVTDRHTHTHTHTHCYSVVGLSWLVMAWHSFHWAVYVAANRSVKTFQHHWGRNIQLQDLTVQGLSHAHTQTHTDTHTLPATYKNPDTHYCCLPLETCLSKDKKL